MKFLSLGIHNFGAIGEASVDLADRGLMLVQGENNDNSSAVSNGAGKSTIAEALSWCLYGKTAKGVSGDSVINRVFGKGTKVEVVIEDAGYTYAIARHRKHRTGKNTLQVRQVDSTGAGKDLTLGTDRLTQPVVDRIMGCSHEVFVAAVYAGQEQLPDLPAMTDRHLKVLIEQAAGVTILESAYEIASKRLGRAAKDEKAAQDQVEEITGCIKALIDRVEDAKDVKKRWFAEREARVMDMERVARTAVEDSRKLKGEIAKLPDPRSLKIELTEARAKLEGLKTEQARHEAYQKAERSADLARQRAEDEARRMTQEAVRLAQKAKAAREQVGKPCDECGRAHDEKTLAHLIEGAEAAAVEQKRAARQFMRDDVQSARNALETRTDARKRFQASMTDASATSAHASDLERQLADRSRLQERYDGHVKRATETVAAIKREREAKNPHDAKIAELGKQLDDARAKRVIREVAYETAQEDARTAADVARVFSPAGVRAHILDTVTPYLNERTAHYLGTLTDGQSEAVWQTLTRTAKGELREKFSIEVDGRIDGFATMSGGEKRKVRLACAMALQDLVATRATKPIELFVADEIDDALDPAGLERLMGILEEKARERGSVFLISHSNLKDWCKSHLVIAKEEGVATIVEGA